MREGVHVGFGSVAILLGADLRGVGQQWFEELGGEVVLLGKPAAVLYEEALRMLGLRKD